MNVTESFTTALESLRANKMRTILTMLGVIIGVGSVISMIGIAQGARQQTLEQIQALGANVLTVMSGQSRRGGASMGFGSAQTLKVSDAEAILKNCPAVIRVSPEVSQSYQVKYGNSNTFTSINGTGHDHPVIRNLKIVEGRYFNDRETRSMARVAVLGYTAWESLFAGQPAMGKRIRINGQTYEVVGRAAYKGSTGFRNPDDAIYIPYTTAMRRLIGVNYIRSISVQARSADALNDAQTQVEETLIKEHRLPANGTLDFRIFNQAEFTETAEQTSSTFTFLLAGVALVSLIVGGIGIMNIMLVSVTERTREIGLRKAIGATPMNIMTQFLIEAVVMSVLGGLLGIALGYLAAGYISSQANWAVSIPPMAIAVAFGFAAFIGVFFGLYPAWRAAQLQPIEALRYE